VFGIKVGHKKDQEKSTVTFHVIEQKVASKRGSDYEARYQKEEVITNKHSTTDARMTIIYSWFGRSRKEIPLFDAEHTDRIVILSIKDRFFLTIQYDNSSEYLYKTKFKRWYVTTTFFSTAWNWWNPIAWNPYLPILIDEQSIRKQPFVLEQHDFVSGTRFEDIFVIIEWICRYQRFHQNLPKSKHDAKIE
jgi:hypothetical protein